MTIKLPRDAKGKRPDFFPAEPAADRLLTMVMALAGELAVVRERLDTIERLAAEKDLITNADIEAYEPSITVLEEREASRQQFLDRLFQVLNDEMNAPDPANPPADSPGK